MVFKTIVSPLTSRNGYIHSRKISVLVSLAILAQFAFLVVNKTSVPAGLLFILALLGLSTQSARPPLENTDRHWFFALLGLALIPIFSLTLNGVTDSSSYERWIRFALGAIIFWHLCSLRIPVWITGTACVLLILPISWIALFGDGLRSLGANFHKFSYLLLVGSTVILVKSYFSNKWIIKVALGVIGCVGIFASFERDSVSTLIGLIAFFGYLIVETLINPKTRRSSLAIGIVAVVGLAITFSIPNGLERAVRGEIKKANLALQNQNAGNMALRIRMVQVSLEAANQSPLIGNGPNYKEISSTFGVEIPGPNISRYHHFHNQYLDMAAKFGWPATLSFLLFLLFGWWHKNWKTRIQLGAVMVPLAIIGLGETVLASNQIALLAILLPALIRSEEQVEPHS